jgi:Kef-type K+ transport system membrane component KefB
MSSASKNIDFSQTRIGTVLISAAIIDDVCGLVLVSVISQLGNLQVGGNLGWVIGRPILASALLGILTPAFVLFCFRPLYRHALAPFVARFKHRANFVLMLLVLCAFISIAAYAGASVLLGAFLAGTFLSSLPVPQDEEVGVAVSPGSVETITKIPTFMHTFEKYLQDVQHYILQPLFFASIGFAIPFTSLWSGEVIWKGIVFSILMVIGKICVGVSVPAWDLSARVLPTFLSKTKKSRMKEIRGVLSSTWPSATLLGTAMVARGEIGLLVIQIGFNDTTYLSEKAFVIGVWAIILNTILGPISVGIILGRIGTRIAESPAWGIQEKEKATAPVPNRVLGEEGLDSSGDNEASV